MDPQSADLDAYPPPSSVSQLPIEVLQDIFVLAHQPTQKERIYSWWNPLDTKELPWTVSRVCQTWRNVAFGTHIIWASGLILDLKLHIPNKEADLEELNSEYETFTHPFISLLKECLKHTGSRPLSFSCRYAGHPLQLQIISLFTPHSERWLRFQLIFSPSLILPKGASIWLKAITGRLPILQNLRIINWRDQNPARDIPSLEALFQEPSLRTFDGGEAQWQTSFLLQLPLHQMKRIALNSSEPMGETLRIISKTSDLLVQCVITGSMFTPEPSSRGIITLRNLRNLRICVRMETILDHLDLPALEELTVHGGTAPSLLQVDCITRFLTRPRSAPNLRSLEIGAPCSACDSFYGSLAARPRIQKLYIPMKFNTISFFLSPHSSTGIPDPFLPDLQHLGLSDIQADQMKGALAVVEQRLRRAAEGNKPRSFVYSGVGASKMSKLLRKRLTALVKGGLDAVFETPEAMQDRLARSALLQG